MIIMGIVKVVMIIHILKMEDVINVQINVKNVNLILKQIKLYVLNVNKNMDLYKINV